VNRDHSLSTFVGHFLYFREHANSTSISTDNYSIIIDSIFYYVTEHANCILTKYSRSFLTFVDIFYYLTEHANSISTLHKYSRPVFSPLKPTLPKSTIALPGTKIPFLTSFSILSNFSLALPQMGCTIYSILGCFHLPCKICATACDTRFAFSVAHMNPLLMLMKARPG